MPLLTKFDRAATVIAVAQALARALWRLKGLAESLDEPSVRHGSCNALVHLAVVFGPLPCWFQVVIGFCYRFTTLKWDVIKVIIWLLEVFKIHFIELNRFFAIRLQC